jgi:hypothetical protein
MRSSIRVGSCLAENIRRAKKFSCKHSSLFPLTLMAEKKTHIIKTSCTARLKKLIVFLPMNEKLERLPLIQLMLQVTLSEHLNMLHPG